jgi:hypothetical protein
LEQGSVGVGPADLKEHLTTEHGIAMPRYQLSFRPGKPKSRYELKLNLDKECGKMYRNISPAIVLYD